MTYMTILVGGLNRCVDVQVSHAIRTDAHNRSTLLKGAGINDFQKQLKTFIGQDSFPLQLNKLESKESSRASKSCMFF